MRIQEDKDPFILIEQAHHASISKQIIKNWKFDVFYAIYKPDIGWQSFDEQPFWNDKRKTARENILQIKSHDKRSLSKTSCPHTTCRQFITFICLNNLGEDLHPFFKNGIPVSKKFNRSAF